ncbi:hypothetical protein SASPL_145178 [Salvia splendens]|uniref:Uncharacterized protein n=1 Tax=Salvia splendens TaxID=180675 RepID=A0A8X8Z847_SALSN|nr:hypothetical protein SASPL_145178 [Salvia splendens]
MPSASHGPAGSPSFRRAQSRPLHPLDNIGRSPPATTPWSISRQPNALTGRPGEDSEEEEGSNSSALDRQDEDGVNMAITGDVSRIFVIGQKIKPRSIRLTGNGASMRCDYVSLRTPLMLQGHSFDIDLFLLQVEGPDVVLGV